MKKKLIVVFGVLLGCSALAKADCTLYDIQQNAAGQYRAELYCSGTDRLTAYYAEESLLDWALEHYFGL